jgi:predicted alpha/beta-hydrolase family hydrolase
VHLDEVSSPAGLVALGHGAGGGVAARDLQIAARVASGLGWSVALVEQPYRVAGRRSPAPAAQLDAAWVAVIEEIALAGVPLVVGGRS